MTKADLQDEIKVLKHNIKALEERLEIAYARSMKMVEFLYSTGKMTKEINEITRLECEKR